MITNASWVKEVENKNFHVATVPCIKLVACFCQALSVHTTVSAMVHYINSIMGGDCYWESVCDVGRYDEQQMIMTGS